MSNLPAARYTGVAITLHWLLAVLILGQILFGWYLEEVPRGTPDRTIYVNLHKSFGLTLLPLILFRVYWRWTHPAPAFPESMAPWERTAAGVSHGLLYACMIVMPLAGYIASNFSEWGVNFYNVVKLPPWGVDSEAVYTFFNGTHVITSYVFVTVIAIHVLAGLRHLIARDRIFDRMWPARRSDQGR